MSLTIFHYKGLYERSGVSSYIRRIMMAQQDQGHTIIYADISEGWSGVQVETVPSILMKDEHELSQKVRDHDADLVHAHHGLRRFPQTSVPILRTVHNHQPYCPSRYRHLGRSNSPCPRSYSFSGCLWGLLVDQCGPQRPDRWLEAFRTTWQEQSMFENMRYVAVSDFVRREMVQAGCPRHRVNTLHLPAPDPPEVSPPPSEGPPRFLYMGRLEPQKGVDTLIKAMRMHSACHLDIAGDGPLRGDLVRAAAEHGIEDRISFHGWVPFSTIARLMRQSLAVVLPSTCHETGGLTVLEAMAYGRAVIASKVGAVPELVRSEKTGLLVQPSDSDALAAAMGRLVSDKQLAAELGQKARAIAESQYTLGQHLDQLQAVYEEVVEESTVVD